MGERRRPSLSARSSRKGSGMFLIQKLCLVVVFGFALFSGAAAQYFDDGDDDRVSASYDYDGTLILDSRNFRGMTESGVWVVMFYSYSVVIKDTKEAHDCQKFTWLWGDFAARMKGLGGQPTSGKRPTIHVAKYDTSYESERRYVSLLLSGHKIDALPGIFIFEGTNVRKMEPYDLNKILRRFPDIDRLEGYSRGLKCDPPADYYTALTKNNANLFRLSKFVTDYLQETGRGRVDRPGGITYDNPDDPGVDWDWDDYDASLEVIEAVRAAVTSGDTEGLQLFLEHMAAVNGTGVNTGHPETLQTPLHEAAIGGEVEVVELLLDLGADIEARCEAGETALFKAADHGRRGVMRVLLDAGADVNAPRTSDGASPLHIAALGGRGDVCLMLLRRGADVELRTPKGLSPMHFAVIGGYLDEPSSFEALLNNGADIEGQDHRGWTPLMHSIRVNEQKMMTHLLELGVDLEKTDYGGNTALHYAMHYGMNKIIMELLRRGASPWAENRGGEKAMEVMSVWGNIKRHRRTGEITRHMKKKKRLDNIFKRYTKWWWPLHYFGREMRPDLEYKFELFDSRVRKWAKAFAKATWLYFFDNWPTFWRYMWFPTTIDRRTKHEQFMQARLLEIEEFEDKQTWGGDNEGDVWLLYMGEPEYERLRSYTELQRAVYFSQWWVVKELLEAGRVEWAVDFDGAQDTGQVLIPSNGGGTVKDGYGALRFQHATVDLEVRDETGATPIMVAAKNKDYYTIELLAKYGADLEATDDFGTTALMKAVEIQEPKVAELLLKMGAVPDTRMSQDLNQTALMLASAQGDLAVVVTLLKHGADMDAMDVQGRTPMNYAFAAARHELVEWMKSKGAVMRDDGRCVAPLYFPKPDPEGYSPIDRPEQDWRNPRFSGSLG